MTREHAHRAILTLDDIGQRGLAIAETPAETIAALELASGVARYLTVSLAHLFGEEAAATMRAARCEAACAIAAERVEQNETERTL